jgi:integrase
MSKKKLTQAKLADRAGIAVNTTASIIHGKNTRRSTAEKIVVALGKNFEDLFEISEHKALSGTTIRHYHRFLASVLHQAVYWQMLFSNPCDRVRPPRAEKHEARYLDEFEAVQLMEALDSQPNVLYATITKFLMLTGLRRGECFGIEYRDIDFENRLLTINKSLLTTNSAGTFLDETKNSSSDRVIKLPVTANELIQNWREYQTQDTGEPPKDTDRVFDAHPNTYTSWVNAFVKRKNLPSICPHSLRHTHSTLLIASGASIPAVSKRLGHSSVATTERVYTHAIRSADEKAAEIIEDIFSPNKK